MWHARPLPFRIAVIAGMIVLFTGIFGAVVQQLWNALMPYLFHLPLVTFWQGVGLALLSRLLLGHFPGRHGGPRGFGRHGGHCGPFGRSRGCESERDLDIQGGPRAWKRYGTYWNEEGKAHFETWLQRQDEKR